MRATLRLWIVILLLTSNALSAQDVVLSVGAPSTAGMDETILAAAVHMYETAVRQDQVRNVVLLVARDGKVVLHEALGWKDKEQGIPLAKDAMFRMASNTKPVIATGISILVEEGKLNYRDLVRRHIAAFDNYRSGAITIHHLLTHTSGFRIEPIFFDPLTEKSPEHPDAPSLQLEVNRFGEVGATEPVGATYSYSNPGYNTLGALIEVASDQPLDVFLRERIYGEQGVASRNHPQTPKALEAAARMYTTSCVFGHDGPGDQVGQADRDDSGGEAEEYDDQPDQRRVDVVGLPNPAANPKDLLVRPGKMQPFHPCPFWFVDCLSTDLYALGVLGFRSS